MVSKMDVRDRFCDDTYEFLLALQGVWPECDGVQGVLWDFQATINCGLSSMRDLARNTLVEKYHAHMAPLYELCRAQDPSIART